VSEIEIHFFGQVWADDFFISLRIPVIKNIARGKYLNLGIFSAEYFYLFLYIMLRSDQGDILALEIGTEI